MENTRYLVTYCDFQEKTSLSFKEEEKLDALEAFYNLAISSLNASSFDLKDSKKVSISLEDNKNSDNNVSFLIERKRLKKTERFYDSPEDDCFYCFLKGEFDFKKMISKLKKNKELSKEKQTIICFNRSDDNDDKIKQCTLTVGDNRI